ncbi:MAG: TraR/DksA family transcriptional regulator [Burkholderiaceae bacterium]
MTTHLTTGQRALLESALLQRQHALDQRLKELTAGQTRAEHAHEVLLQDSDDAPQRDNDRIVDMALSDSEMQELGAVSQALLRLRGDAFGVCAACSADIPFDRLKVEPWALRCTPCQTVQEQARGH